MDERALAWTMIFGSIYGIAYHPRAVDDAKKNGSPLMRADQAARLADDAMLEWDRRWNRARDGVKVPPG